LKVWVGEMEDFDMKVLVFGGFFIGFYEVLWRGFG
jgi:hypothetical protein